MSTRHPVRVNAESMKTIKQISKEREIDNGEAADYLVSVARGRLAALNKDNRRRASGKPASLRKVTVKVIKKGKSKK
jgi:hypothetical protein